MSFQAKRELLTQTAPRYQAASHGQKSIILDAFVAATGYDRKYAIRLLTHPVAPPAPITRPRAPRYGPAVQEALRLAWAASNGICAKRPVPFLSELVPILERHGHLILTAEVRVQLLAISPATADRILHTVRNGAQPRGIGTTKHGALLKHHIPVRTFTDWNDTRPGFMEADLVAHCGGNTAGAFLHTLVLTDIASGWTECLPLLHRSHAAVIQALDRVRQLLPFPLLGFDTDNGTEFLNTELLAYCEREQITFTRGRAGKKNDQWFVEQKTGVIILLLQKPLVRQIDTLLVTAQRFGAVRDVLATLPCATNPDFNPTRAWQTLMRWLLYFLPRRYERVPSRHSEVLRRTSIG